ncbi:MAG: hypothetical protein ACR2RF_24970 [Geminicoccaceae bacterium]
MTTDPIERVARAWYERAGSVHGPWIEITAEQRQMARIGAQWMFDVLTEQGIPIDKLLTGEMVAVEKDCYQPVLDVSTPETRVAQANYKKGDQS